MRVGDNVAVESAGGTQVGFAGAGRCERALHIADAAELADEPAFRFGDAGEKTVVADVELLAFDELEQQIVEAFERDRFVRVDPRDGIAGFAHVCEREDQEAALVGILDQLDLGRKDDGAGTFGSHQRARDVELVFGEEFVERISRDAARNIRKSLADVGCIAIAQLA